jgi:hypothetical protein
MSAPWGFGVCTGNRRTRVAWYAQCKQLGLPYIAVWQRRGVCIGLYDTEVCERVVEIEVTAADRARLRAFFHTHGRRNDTGMCGAHHGTLRVHAPPPALVSVLLEALTTAAWRPAGRA